MHSCHSCSTAAGGGRAAVELLRAGQLERPDPWGRKMNAAKDILAELQANAAPAPGKERLISDLLEELEREWFSSPANRSSTTQAQLEELRRAVDLEKSRRRLATRRTRQQQQQQQPTPTKAVRQQATAAAAEAVAAAAAATASAASRAGERMHEEAAVDRGIELEAATTFIGSTIEEAIKEFSRSKDKEK